MNPATILVLLLIAALTALAVRTIGKRRLLFTCGGDCARCRAGCRKRT